MDAPARKLQMHRAYARAWVDVKHFYGLSVDATEKAALTGYLADC